MPLDRTPTVRTVVFIQLSSFDLNTPQNGDHIMKMTWRDETQQMFRDIVKSKNSPKSETKLRYVAELTEGEWIKMDVYPLVMAQRLSVAREGGHYTPRHAGKTSGQNAAPQPA